ncbi:hypothetical protein A3D03_03995 [Candidatus Gottesmanbacteria bacterium RIFCSPHIGHO2_02_FULL_40_13]|uniref:SHS2 domain-containing protein n=1 Tax=Candidatus Gottesmanbacteria bacterium RIFCSPHIGHO2_02_FULL_40_13 TaxID=1798384 RepID=A0A1F6A8C5_9BACT|nr:MAG: hypothetical protein A3D03_03995 [Candidatus Gottesmanbacteria bacterium RIFCSPHIGHO2_02_FULL_40_13]
MSNILIGLDIGSSSIKAAQISKDKAISTLLAAGYIATPVRDVTSMNEHDEQELANSINHLVHDMKVSNINVSASLPSSKVITRIVEMPLMDDKELASSIQWEAEQYIPFPLTKVKLDYAVVSANIQTKKMNVLLVAAQISLIESYMRIITLAGLNPIALETEIMAIGRSVGFSLPTVSDVLIVSIGANATDIALMHDMVLSFTKSYPIGGNNMSQAIAEELGFEIAQAEEYKKTYGLEEHKLEGKIAKIISPYINNLIEEMEKIVAFYKKTFASSEISTVVISGAASKLPGLVLTITKNLGLDSQLSNPFINLSVDPKILPKLTEEAPLYTTSIGLALKETD